MLHRIVAVVLGGWLSVLSAQAQTSTQRVRADTSAQYALLKQVIGNELHEWTGRPGSEIDFPCVQDAGVFRSKDDQITAMGFLAAETVQADRILRWAKYPPSVWEKSLADAEQRQLARIRGGNVSRVLYGNDIEALKTKLAAYRQTKPGLPRISWELECGGTFGHTVTVVIQPPGRRIRYIEALYYTFCASQGIDPKKFRECNLWNTLNHGEEATFDGAYWYQVERSDGSSTEPRRKDFSDTPDSVKRWVVN
ncbi:hypothetical protein ACKWRH_28295 [Bradyrhizobium sp. Pa8]|uniref:hypothetical protein n=1 Tax=Bradyrhizobium sp. Pa8 TaxID=3386552 RepID=UPI00403F27B8